MALNDIGGKGLLKVLVVDDEPEIGELSSMMLGGKGYETERVESGKEAINKFKKKQYDIVLLDIVLGDMDGLDVLKQIKKVRPATIVVMITAYATIKGAIRAMKIGASDYIPKPFSWDDLLETIQGCIDEVNYLEKFKEFKSKYDSKSCKIVKALSNPIRRNTMDFLYTNGNTHFMGLVQGLKVKDHTKLAFHLRKLRHCGLVSQNKDKEYLITKKGKEVLETLNNMEVKLKNDEEIKSEIL